MPLKYQLLVGFFWLLGGGIAAALLARAVFAWRAGRGSRAAAALAALGVFLGLAFSLCYVYIPSFNPFRPALARGNTAEKLLALTFDDGPNEPYTAQILDILKTHQVPATFFLIGENVRRHPESIRRILAEGHQIGNHTYSHRSMLSFDNRVIEGELEAWENLLNPMGVQTRLFRAPHGWKVPWLYSVLDRKNYRLVSWTRGVWDTDPVDEETLFRRLTERMTPGEILLLHDGIETRPEVDRSVLVRVLPRVLRYYQAQGYQIVPLTQLLDEPASKS